MLGKVTIGASFDVFTLNDRFDELYFYLDDTADGSFNYDGGATEVPLSNKAWVRVWARGEASSVSAVEVHVKAAGAGKTLYYGSTCFAPASFDAVVEVDVDQATDSILVYGFDGSANQKVLVDASGHLQVDVLASALPAGAATEAKQDTQITAEHAILAKIIAAPATEAKQDTQITAEQAILAKIIAAPATEAKQDTQITAEQATKTAVETLAGAVDSGKVKTTSRTLSGSGDPISSTGGSLHTVEDSAPAILLNAQAPLADRAWSTRVTDNVASGAWNTAKAIDVGSDTVHLSALSVSLGTIAGITDVDWYLSWDAAGAEPITDRQSWTLATDMALDRAGTSRIAVAKIDLGLKRPAGVGTADTIYLHTYGTAGTAAGIWTASGSY
jgi:hypothetical protein